MPGRTRKVEITFVAVTLLIAAIAGLTLLLGRPEPQEPPLPDGVVVALVPHPDDEAYGMAATIASLVRQGRPVTLVLFTDGESSADAEKWAQGPGEDLDSDGDTDMWDFGLARRAEFAASAEALGVTDVVYLGRASSQGATGYADGALTGAETMAKDIESLGEERGAAALLTVAPYGALDPIKGDVRDHPDHSATSRAVKEAAFALAVRSYHYKVYVYTWPAWARLAPVRVAGSEADLAARRESIEAYSDLGRASTPELWDAAFSDTLEYMVPGSDLQ